MKNKCVKLLGTLTLGVLMMTNNAFGQAPADVTIGTTKYFEHGRNSAGATTASENTDSVTMGSTMTYFVLPDPTFNATWYSNGGTATANISNPAGITSAFDWTVTPTGGGAGSISNTATPIIKTINWTAAGTANIEVQEKPTSLACIGSPTIIPVQIIPKPTITFNQGPAYSDAACHPESEKTGGGFVYPFPITVTSAVAGKEDVLVSYTVTKDGTPDGALSGTDIPVANGTGSLTNTIKFPDYGVYVITITKLTDRISRKSGDTGTSGMITVGGSATFTYNVMKPVQTGPVYHLPNM